MNRAEHLAWAKARALEYLPAEPGLAVASMLSDLSKHASFLGKPYTELANLGLVEAMRGADAVRRWIEGFN